MPLLFKLLIHGRRLLGARRFGIPYVRAAKLEIPRRIRINDSMIPVYLPNDTGIKSDILGCLLEDVYGLRSLSSPPSTILDIGANAGLSSLAARARFPKALIHAYEPNPRTLPYLQHQGKEADFVVFPEAVGASEGLVSIADEGDSNLARVVPESAGDMTVVKVGLNKAVRRLGEKVDLVKIDCEGAEWELFEDRQAWKAIERVRMEYHLFQRQTFQQLVDTMRSLGFSISKHISSGGFGLVWCERIK